MRSRMLCCSCMSRCSSLRICLISLSSSRVRACSSSLPSRRNSGSSSSGRTASSSVAMLACVSRAAARADKTQNRRPRGALVRPHRRLPRLTFHVFRCTERRKLPKPIAENMKCTDATPWTFARQSPSAIAGKEQRWNNALKVAKEEDAPGRLLPPFAREGRALTSPPCT